MNQNVSTLSRAFFHGPLRRIYYKTRRFLWNILPDVLVVAVSVVILMQIWEWCFWR